MWVDLKIIPHKVSNVIQNHFHDSFLIFQRRSHGRWPIFLYVVESMNYIAYRTVPNL